MLTLPLNDCPTLPLLNTCFGNGPVKRVGLSGGFWEGVGDRKKTLFFTGMHLPLIVLKL